MSTYGLAPVDGDEMARKEEILAELTGIPEDVIRQILNQNPMNPAWVNNAIEDVATVNQHLQNHSDDAVVTDVLQPRQKLRPLNAYMAFRSYYARICQNVPQKEVSGFITHLWNHECNHNAWALLGKMYSTIRDTVGREKITLRNFLLHACPIMKIVSPENYLTVFGWSNTFGEEGERILTQNQTIAKAANQQQKQQATPNTELELLQKLLESGFMTGYEGLLMNTLRGNSSALMTTPGGNIFTSFSAIVEDDVLGISSNLHNNDDFAESANFFVVDDVDDFDPTTAMEHGENTFKPENSADDEPANSDDGEEMDTFEPDVDGQFGTSNMNAPNIPVDQGMFIAAPGNHLYGAPNVPYFNGSEMFEEAHPNINIPFGAGGNMMQIGYQFDQSQQALMHMNHNFDFYDAESNATHMEEQTDGMVSMEDLAHIIRTEEDINAILQAREDLEQMGTGMAGVMADLHAARIQELAENAMAIQVMHTQALLMNDNLPVDAWEVDTDNVQFGGNPNQILENREILEHINPAIYAIAAEAHATNLALAEQVHNGDADFSEDAMDTDEADGGSDFNDFIIQDDDTF